MKLIAHRGNTKGPCPELENEPEYVLAAIRAGFDCEVDLRLIDGEMFLGHDEPKHRVDEEFILFHRSKLWIHCKNFQAIEWIAETGSEVNGFWHENDSYTLTSQAIIWTYPGHLVGSRSVIVDNRPEALAVLRDSLYGLCGDYVG